MASTKRLVFYTLQIPVIILTFGLITVASIFKTISDFIVRISKIAEILSLRLELWGYDIKKESYYNCPFQKTLKQIWKEEI